jgi:hypothetical protein
MPKPFVYYDMLYTYQHFALQLYDLFIYLFASDWSFTFGGFLITNVYLGALLILFHTCFIILFP